MKDLAASVKDVGIKNVQFITVPVQEYPADPNRVEWAPSADVLWQTLRGRRGRRREADGHGIRLDRPRSP